MLNIEALRLTARDANLASPMLPNEQQVADAQLAKVLYVLERWLESDDGATSLDGYAYGGPDSCEYGCLTVVHAHIKGLLDALEQANIEHPGKNVEVVS